MQEESKDFPMPTTPLFSAALIIEQTGWCLFPFEQ